MASALLRPVVKPVWEETLKALGDQFNLEKEVLLAVKDTGMVDLEELRFYWSTEEGVSLFVDGIKDKDAPWKRLQAARLKRAWAAVRQCASIREADKSKMDTADLDDLLDEVTMADLKACFWTRYKSKFPAEIMPGDSLVGRCAREMTRRLLTVYDVSLVKSLMHQVTKTKRRRQLAGDLHVYDEEEVVESRDYSEYLDKLFTYLLALAMAGAQRLPSAPEARMEASLGSDTTQFVSVPLDIVLQYWWRAKRTSQARPEYTRLGWLKKLDTAERAVWVEEFRGGDSTLGKVIKQTMEKRDAHWEAGPVGGPAGQPGERPGPQAAGQARKQPRRTQRFQSLGPTAQKAARKGKGKGKDTTRHKVATEFRDGKQLCPDYQRGACNKNTCSQGLHRCGVTLPTGRVCGGPHNPAGHGQR